MKKILADASSAILLFKSGLFGELTASYHVIMAEAVYGELTHSGYLGAEVFISGRREKRFRVCQPSGKLDISSLGRGEHDTICLYLERIGDFILIDDGKGAGYCRKKGVPYISALLFPRLLHLAGKMSRTAYERKTEGILRRGRYSRKITEDAENCPADALEFFLP